MSSAPPTAAQLARIAERLEPGGSVMRSWPLTGGSSATMTAFELAGSAGQRRQFVVRQTPSWSPAANEFRILALVAAEGLPVRPPILLGEASDILASEYLVLDYAEGEPSYGPALSDEKAAAMAKTLTEIHAVDVAGADFRFLRTDGDARSLLHGDFWPGNVLWEGETLTAVIDWEDALLGDPLLDVAITRLDLAIIHGREATARFTEHYFDLRGSGAALQPWDRRAIARMEPHLVEWNAGWAGLGRPDLTMDVIRERFAAFVEWTKA